MVDERDKMYVIPLLSYLENAIREHSFDSGYKTGYDNWYDIGYDDGYEEWNRND